MKENDCEIKGKCVIKNRTRCIWTLCIKLYFSISIGGSRLRVAAQFSKRIQNRIGRFDTRGVYYGQKLKSEPGPNCDLKVIKHKIKSTTRLSCEIGDKLFV